MLFSQVKATIRYTTNGKSNLASQKLYFETSNISKQNLMWGQWTFISLSSLAPEDRGKATLYLIITFIQSEASLESVKVNPDIKTRVDNVSLEMDLKVKYNRDNQSLA